MLPFKGKKPNKLGIVFSNERMLMTYWRQVPCQDRAILKDNWNQQEFPCHVARNHNDEGQMFSFLWHYTLNLDLNY